MARTCSVVILNCVADWSPSFVLHCCVDLNWSSKIRLSVFGSPIGDTERGARCWIRIVGFQSGPSSSSSSSCRTRHVVKTTGNQGLCQRLFLKKHGLLGLSLAQQWLFFKNFFFKGTHARITSIRNKSLKWLPVLEVGLKT